MPQKTNMAAAKCFNLTSSLFLRKIEARTVAKIGELLTAGATTIASPREKASSWRSNANVVIIPTTTDNLSGRGIRRLRPPEPNDLKSSMATRLPNVVEKVPKNGSRRVMEPALLSTYAVPYRNAAPNAGPALFKVSMDRG